MYKSDRLRALLRDLSQGLVEREDAVRAMVLAALAGEHTLLIGPPGTAKSELARRLQSAFTDARYFERLLTRFTVPEELFGPLSLQALEADRYERRTEGYLPACEVAFIDEVFRANSAILNALLMILNERAFDNGTLRVQVPLVSLVGATNLLPDDDSLAAVLDRFLMRVQIEPVSAEGFEAMLRSGPAPVDAAHRISKAELTALLARREQVTLTEPVVELLSQLRVDAQASERIVSDRRWRKCVGLLQTAALTCGRDHVSVWDTCVLPWALSVSADDFAWATERVAFHLGLRADFRAERSARVVAAFQTQLDLERDAQELDFDEGGKLSFVRDAQERAALNAAPRLASAMRGRRYGPHHIAARLAQVDAMLQEFNDYAAALVEQRADFEAVRMGHLWMPTGFVSAVDSSLAKARSLIEEQITLLREVRVGFAGLPQREHSNEDREPEPVDLFQALGMLAPSPPAPLPEGEGRSGGSAPNGAMRKRPGGGGVVPSPSGRGLG